MTTNALYIGLTVLLITSCSDKSNPIQQPKDLEAEAEAFALKVVESILQKDASTFKQALADTIYFLEPWEEPVLSTSIPVEEFFSQLEGPFTLERYFDTYEYQIMSFAEYATIVNFDEFTFWKPDEQDYLFWGSQIKEGHSPFLLDDLLVFMISKRSGAWEIRVLSS